MTKIDVNDSDEKCELGKTQAYEMISYRIDCPKCGEPTTLDEEPSMYGVIKCSNEDCDVEFHS